MSIHTQSPRRSRSKTSTRSPSTLSPKQKPSKQHKTNTHQSPSKSPSKSTPTTTANKIKAFLSRPPAPPLTTHDCNVPQSPLQQPKRRRNSHKSQHKQQQQQQEKQPKTKPTPKQRKSVAFHKVVTVRPHHPQRPTNQMSVSFHEVVMVRPILHLADYTDDEISDCWFGKADKLKTKQDLLKTLKLLKAGNNTSIVASRGLEKFCDGGKARESRRTSIREVLNEQESQRQRANTTSGSSIVYDLSKFRKAYKPHSRAARHVAYAVGKIDEMEAACQKVVAAMPSNNNKMVWTRR